MEMHQGLTVVGGSLCGSHETHSLSRQETDDCSNESGPELHFRNLVVERDYFQVIKIVLRWSC